MVAHTRISGFAPVLVGVILAVTTAIPVSAATAQVTGWLDLAQGGNNSITVAGWAADPDSDVTANVHVYVDGVFAAGGPADRYRPDVERVTGLGEFRGFRMELAASPGWHQVCVYGIDRTGDPNRRLGCETVEVTDGSLPRGWLDSATVVEGGVQVRGWALDPDTTESIGVHVYVNGIFHSGFKADRSRPDVGKVFGLGDDHGFEETLDLYSGWHWICLYGIDRTGDKNALIECAFVAIPFDQGVVVTDAGVVLPVVDTGEGAWTVFTPCTNHAQILFEDASFVDAVDVVIDPGHGGSETGAADNGLVEKTLNVDISLRVRDLLEEAGYTVLLTRYDDYRLPLKTRGAIAQGVGAAVFVSIHHNGGATNKAGHPGTMTLYQHDLDESRRLATLLFTEMFDTALEHPTSWVSNSLTGASSRLSRPGRDFYGVHRYTPDIPSVITEWGYITNPAEADQLKTEKVKNAEAGAIARAIIEWFETTNTGGGDIGTWTGTSSSSTGGTSGCVDPSLP